MKDLFKVFNNLFVNPQSFLSMNDYEKSKYFFMFQRFFAIQYPVQADIFNIKNINTAEVLDYWCNSLSKIYKRTPAWVYNTLKSVKTEKEEKKKINIDDDVIMYWCQLNECSRKEFYEIYDKYGDEFIKAMQKFQKNFK
jgi:hypothetical protein